MRIKYLIHIGLIIIALASWPGSFLLSAGNIGSEGMPQSSGLTIAVFDVDATPPVGSHMAYNPVKNTWDMGLRARGIVLSGSGKPIVLCSIDWLGIGNESQDEFRRVLSEAAGTTPDRVANPDFPGLTRFYRQLAVPDALYIHFNGAGGNLGAGKYNDGSHENRGILAERLADGMKRAWEATKKESLNPETVAWAVESISLPPAAYPENFEKNLKSKSNDAIFLTNTIPKIMWLDRCRKGGKLDIGCLSIGRARILHMPGELMVEFQLAAKAEKPDLFVTMAAYGDYGPEYICTDAAYEEGGYEAGDASGVAPGSEKIIMTAIKKLLSDFK